MYYITVPDTVNIPLPPTQDQLPCSDGIPMETERHKLQMNILVEPLQEWLKERSTYVGGNKYLHQNIYTFAKYKTLV